MYWIFGVWYLVFGHWYLVMKMFAKKQKKNPENKSES